MEELETGDARRVAELLAEYAELERKSLDEGLAIDDLERRQDVKLELQCKMNSGIPSHVADRRRSVRVPTRLRCRFETLDNFEDALITNLSKGGVFIATSSPLPVGTRLRLVIRIGDTDDVETEVPAEVVSNNVGPDLEPGRAGMGLRFGEVVPEMLRELHGIYREAVSQYSRDLAALADVSPESECDAVAGGELESSG